MDLERTVRLVRDECLDADTQDLYGRYLDADDVLQDFFEDVTHRDSGTSCELLDMWLKASKKERAVIEAVFYLLIDRRFEAFLDRCIKQKERSIYA